MNTLMTSSFIDHGFLLWLFLIFLKCKSLFIYICLFIIIMVSPSGPRDDYLHIWAFCFQQLDFFNMQVLEFSYESSLQFVLDTGLGERFVLEWLIRKYSQKDKQTNKHRWTEEQDYEEKKVIYFLTHPSTWQRSSNFFISLIPRALSVI